ncbi:Lancl1 protein [Echinococcus multilocularis]|uniref:Lancl1 protein n=1 Tax=Echinococcus multilocularis TaxID=6211 RepID=A0A068Y2D6_ECHMU|nr:Lancl1 protein [Echinococcus multilocularis]
MRYFQNPYVGPYGEVPSGTPLPSVDDFVQMASDMVKDCFQVSCRKISIHDGGLYVGGIGVAWAALRVMQRLGEKGFEAFLPQVRKYIEGIVSKAAQDAPRDNEERLSFLLGMPGVWLTAAYLYQLSGEVVERDRFLGLYAQLAPVFASLQPGNTKVIFSQGSDEFFIGRAGYLCGLHELRKVTSEAVVSDETIFAICDAIIDSGRAYAKRHHSQCPLMFAYHGTEYLGAAHGLAGILFALLLFPQYLQTHKAAAEEVRAAVDYLIAVTPPDTGNLPVATDELPPHRRSASDELVHWCHGDAGVVYVYARAYVLWKDEKYLREVVRCADVAWHKGLLKKGPGLCHGVAGSGYTQLAALRATGEQRYAERARACAAFLHSEVFLRGARRPDNPASLFEGRAGTSLFLADLTHPELAAFPFMDPFECS